MVVGWKQHRGAEYTCYKEWKTVIRKHHGKDSTLLSPFCPIVQHILQGLQLLLGRSIVFHFVSYIADYIYIIYMLYITYIFVLYNIYIFF